MEEFIKTAIDMGVDFLVLDSFLHNGLFDNLASTEINIENLEEYEKQNRH
jgi:hypothetical protein